MLGFLAAFQRKGVAKREDVRYNYAVKNGHSPEKWRTDSHVQCYDRNAEGKSPEDCVH